MTARVVLVVEAPVEAFKKRVPTQVIEHPWPFAFSGDAKGLVRNISRPQPIERRKPSSGPSPRPKKVK